MIAYEFIAYQEISEQRPVLDAIDDRTIAQGARLIEGRPTHVRTLAFGVTGGRIDFHVRRRARPMIETSRRRELFFDGKRVADRRE